MQSYQQGQNTAVTFAFKDLNGNAIVPLALSMRLLDENEVVLVPATPVALPSPLGTSIQLSITAAENTLSTAPIPANIAGTNLQIAPPTIGARTVELTITAAEGQVVLSQTYVILATTQLVLLTNSFQTIASANMRSTQMPNMTAWNLASDNDKIAAMMDAYLRLTRMGYFVRWPRDPDAQNIIVWFESSTNVITPRLWALMTPERFLTYYPETFRQALYKAQIAEANYRLSPSIPDQKRQAGIIAERIGESNVTFRPGKIYDIGLSKDAIVYLTGFLDNRFTITRS